MAVIDGDPQPVPAQRRPPRVPYFERPPQPRDWRWVVGGIGKALITLGLLMFAFVAYQLWGTGIQTAQSQNDLRHQFDHALQSTSTAAPTTVPPSTSAPTPGSSTSSTSSTTTTIPMAPVGPSPEEGSPVARLRIPKIDLDWTVVQGVSPHDLKKGPGHFKETPMPGQLGNAAIAGHRTTYGHPFYDLDNLQPGDLIEVSTFAGTYTYAVTGKDVVSPKDYALVIPTRDRTKATLTLSTCTPKGTATNRLIIHADFVADKSDPVMRPPTSTTPTPSTTTPGTLPGDSTPSTQPGATTTTANTTPSTTPSSTTPAGATDAFSQGWFDDSGAIPHTLGWGLLLVGICIGSYQVGKRTRRLWVSFLVGAVPFVVVLYFFFENVNRLLPPSL